MKKLTLYIMTTLLLLLLFTPTPTSAVTGKAKISVSENKPTESAANQALITRLDEINAMDKSTLRPPEKRALRKEVRKIKKELSTSSGGVYISVGAIIIILLLLLILL